MLEIIIPILVLTSLIIVTACAIIAVVRLGELVTILNYVADLLEDLSVDSRKIVTHATGEIDDEQFDDQYG